MAAGWDSRGAQSAAVDLLARGDPPTAIFAVNTLVAEAPVQPRLTDHNGYDWHIHYFAPAASLADHLAVDGGMALAHVVAAEEVERLRVCEAPDCEAVLLDLSRNRSKRYCDARTCGNRLNVAAYRERYQVESDLPTGGGAKTDAQRSDRLRAQWAAREAQRLGAEAGSDRRVPPLVHAISVR